LTLQNGGLKIITRKRGKVVNMPRQPIASKSRAPDHSLLFEKLIPALLVLMGILTVALILFAAGVLLGIVHF
jgi:hypothetical protein